MANGYARLWLHESEVFDAMKAAFFGGIGAEETCRRRGVMLCFLGPVLSAFRFDGVVCFGPLKGEHQ